MTTNATRAAAVHAAVPAISRPYSQTADVLIDRFQEWTADLSDLVPAERQRLLAEAIQALSGRLAASYH